MLPAIMQQWRLHMRLLARPMTAKPGTKGCAAQPLTGPINEESRDHTAHFLGILKEMVKTATFRWETRYYKSLGGVWWHFRSARLLKILGSWWDGHSDRLYDIRLAAAHVCNMDSPTILEKQQSFNCPAKDTPKLGPKMPFLGTWQAGQFSLKLKIETI